MRQALFIVFEGIDGSGTTTQCRLLSNYTEDDLGYSVVQTREPGGTFLAERIRRLVLDPEVGGINSKAELFLYAASRAQHIQELIGPALRSGTPVICDRFAASSLAYQGYGRGLELKLVEQVNRLATGDLSPDVTIYLDLPVEIARLRMKNRGGDLDRLERVSADFHERVRQGYRKLAAERPEDSILLDATWKPGELGEKVRAELYSRWPSFPLRK